MKRSYKTLSNPGGIFILFKRSWIWLFLLPGLMSSCLSTHWEDIEITKNDSASIQLSLQVPGQSTPITRAMGDAGELYIKTVDVLAFEVDEDGKEVYRYWAQPFDFTPSNQKKSTFTVNLYKSETDYRFVVLTNCELEVEDLGTIAQGATKEQLLARILKKNQAYWDATSEQTFTPIPMWGESPLVKIDEGVKIEDLTLLRMVARVDVALTKEEVKNKFKFNSVRIYNRKTKGHIVPAANHFNTSTKKVTDPTIPGDNESNYPLNIEYPTDQVYYCDNDTALKQTIYLFEAYAGTKLSDATCLVIGGYYDGDPKETYYRLDFMNSSQQNYIDILRNHLYRFNITAVGGRGHETPDLAYESRPINIEVEIIEWDQSDMNEDVVGYDFFLSVNKSLFEFTKEARTAQSEDNTLKIFTDYWDGWEITKIVEAADTTKTCTWLTVSRSTGPTDQITEVKLLAGENTTATTRAGKIYIAAGRLRHIINVTQSYSGYYDLTIKDEAGNEISELIFPSGLYAQQPIQAQKFIVEWKPTTDACEVSAINGINATANFLFGYSSSILESTTLSANYNGKATYTILPPPMTTDTRERAILGTFILNKAGLTKTITLRQVHYYLETEGVEDSYLLDGNSYSFIVKSNVKWNVAVTDANGVIQSTLNVTGGNPNLPTGDPITFTTINGATPGIATITFTSPENLFAPVEVKINCISNGTGGSKGESNCYIVAPGGYAVDFPVSQANLGWKTILGSEPIGASDQLEAKLLWADRSPAYGTASSLIANIVVEGTGRNARIKVTSGGGNLEGNAVIALRKKGSNDIIWSWHIWVTTYDPDNDTNIANNTYFDGIGGKNKNYTFMNRFLGATSNQPGTHESYGLFYQWGRKDPFAGADVANAIGFTDMKPLYNESGTVKIDTARVREFNNFLNSVRNPSTLYYQHVQNSWSDWYTTHPNPEETVNGVNQKLWGPEKTPFDPCPPGWHVADWSYETWHTFNSTSSWVSFGRINKNEFFAAAGHLYGSHGGGEGNDFVVKNIGRVYQAGKRGMMWSGRIRPTNYYPDNLYFEQENTGSGVSPFGGHQRANAYSIRCVKEEK